MVVAEIYCIVLTVSLVSLLCLGGGVLNPSLLENCGVGLRYVLQQPRYSLSIILSTTANLFILGGPLHREPIVVWFSNLHLVIADPPLLCLISLPYK
jgi:hypothetical protein